MLFSKYSWLKVSLGDLICQTNITGDLNGLQQQQQQQGRGVILKFVMTGLNSGVASVPTVIRMCPPVTTRNIHKYRPLVALGKTNNMTENQK